MTLHGSKSELERLRYHENWDDALINAPQTSESHNFRSDHWIFKIHTFSETRSQNISRGVKINPNHGLLEVAALQGRRLKKHAKAIKSPKHPSNQKKEVSLGSCALLGCFMLIFLLFQTQKTHEKHIKVS